MNTEVIVSGGIPIHLRMGESGARVIFGVVDKLAVPVSLGASFNDKFIKSFHTTEWNVVPNHSSPVPILKVDEASRASEKKNPDIRQFITQDQRLLVTPTSGKPKYTTVGGHVVLKENL